MTEENQTMGVTVLRTLQQPTMSEVDTWWEGVQAKRTNIGLIGVSDEDETIEGSVNVRLLTGEGFCRQLNETDEDCSILSAQLKEKKSNN